MAGQLRGGGGSKGLAIKEKIPFFSNVPNFQRLLSSRGEGGLGLNCGFPYKLFIFIQHSHIGTEVGPPPYFFYCSPEIHNFCVKLCELFNAKLRSKNICIFFIMHFIQTFILLIANISIDVGFSRQLKYSIHFCCIKFYKKFSNS